MKPSPETLIAANKKAFHDYEVLEKLEAGIVLQGSEVKALRQGTVHFPGSYVVSRMPRRAASSKLSAVRSPKSEAGRSANQRQKLPVPVLQLINVHIGPYGPAGPGQHLPLRPRTLLVKRREAERLSGAMQTKGQTVVPLDLHIRHGLVKATIALVRGKQLHDKRRTMKEREVKRTIQLAMKRR